LILEGLHDGHQKKFYEVKDQRYLGEESFIDRIEVEKKEMENLVYDIAIEVIPSEVSKVLVVGLDRLYSMSRERDGAHGRGMVAYLARVVSGHMVKEVANHFRRSPMRISQAIIEF